MTYSTGPGGYGEPSQGATSQGYGQHAQGYGAAPALGQGKGLAFFLSLGVIALGVISFFLGFAAFAKESKDYSGGEGVFSKTSMNFFDNVSLGVGVVSLALLLAAAVIAALAMLPKQESHDAVVAGLSITGFVSLLLLLIGLSEGLDAGIGLILVLVTSFLQSAIAIAVLLFNSGIVKPPQPRQANYGYYGQGGYGQAGYGQSQPQPQSQPQQPYYGGGGAPGSSPTYPPPPSQPQGQQPPPSQPNPQNPW